MNHPNHHLSTSFQSFITHIVETIANDANRNQMKMMMEPSTQFVGFFRFMAIPAFSRQSVKTAGGIIFLNANATPIGTKLIPHSELNSSPYLPGHGA
jgi:hypothetical protein